MTTERWQRVKDIVYTAVELPAEGREMYLDQACNGDMTLRREVETLIEASDRAGTFLDQPALPRATAEDLTGSIIGAYRLAAEIGRGGMGVVYRAVRDDEFRQEAAIKIVKRGMDTDELLARFRHERQILALLNHPNIARMLDGGTTTDGRPYFVMELVAGQRIDTYCEEEGLGIEDRLRLFLKVCGAVAHAHRNLVIHRDLKPANILITAEGDPKLLDFGIAKVFTPDQTGETAGLTAAHVRLLTPEYASPEQVRGDRITTASDIYSLGAILYELLTGAKAHRLANTSPTELERVICLVEPPKPSETSTQRRALRGDLDNIILKALQKQPERRYLHVEQFAEDVRRYLDGRPILARADTIGYRVAKFCRRNTAVTVAAALVLVTLMAGIIGVFWQARIARREKAVAERRFNEVRELANSFLFEVHDAIQNLPGSTPARKLIVERALQYLDRLAKEAKGDRSLQLELAAAYEKVGDVQGGFRSANLGDTAGFLASYRKALAIREAVTAADPANLDAQRKLIRTHGRLSDGLMMEGDLAGSMDQLKQLLPIAERLSGANPADRADRMNLALAYLDYGWKTSARGNCAIALEDCRKSVSLIESLVATDPGDKRSRRVLGLAYSRTGDLFGGCAQNPAESLAMHQKAVDVFHSMLAADPLNTDLRRLELWEIMRTGDENSDPKGALAKFQDALSGLRAMSNADPKNVQFHVDVAAALNRTGAALLVIGNPKAARLELQSSLSELAAFSNPGSPNVDALGTAALGQFRMGRALAMEASDPTLPASARAENWRQAKSWYQRSIPTLTEARERGFQEIDGDTVNKAEREIARCERESRRWMEPSK